MTVVDRVVARAELPDLAECFSGQVIRPGHADYERARRVWNGLIDRRPAIIARCASAADVAAAVQFGRDSGLPIAVRGNGHNVAGSAVRDDGLVIDLSGMKEIAVDPATRVARVQPGVNWGELDQATQAHGLATPGGEVSTTGVSGYTLAGGIGILQRKWGLACDNVLAVEIVTADGQIRRASQTEHPDLFWAIRGGGGNFGVVTRFEFQLYPLGPEIAVAATIYAMTEASAILRGWRDFTRDAPDEITSQALFWSMPPFPDLPAELVRTPIVIVIGVYAGPATTGETVLAPLRALGEPILNLSATAPYVEAQSSFDEFFPNGQYYYWKSLFLDDLDDAMIDAIVLAGAQRPTPETLIALRHLGGAISQIPEDATAFANRNARFNLSLDAVWTDPARSDAAIAWTRSTWADLRERTRGGVYLNFAGLGEENDLLARAGYGRNLDRLREIKRRYDPANLFRANINIAP